MVLVHPPAGRAGRLWLRRRLTTAQRGSDQLGRKLRVLRGERDRLAERGSHAERAWWDAVAEARTWQLRAGLLGGQRAYAQFPPVDPVTVAVQWRTVGGLTIPVAAEVPDPAPESGTFTANAAVVAMTQSFGTALRAASELAVLDESLGRLDAEIGDTRRRVRALDKRWLPALRSALARVEEGLEFNEQEEAARLRRAIEEGAVGHGDQDEGSDKGPGWP